MGRAREAARPMAHEASLRPRSHGEASMRPPEASQRPRGLIVRPHKRGLRPRLPWVEASQASTHGKPREALQASQRLPKAAQLPWKASLRPSMGRAASRARPMACAAKTKHSLGWPCGATSWPKARQEIFRFYFIY